MVDSKVCWVVFMVRSCWIGWNELCAALMIGESAESHLDWFLAGKP
jgi:hypothetical protein